MRWSVRIWAVGLGLLSMCATGTAAAAAATGPQAQSAPSPITDHFDLRASYFRPSIDTDLRLDSHAGVPGTPFNVESVLGLEDRLDQGRLQLMLRLGNRNRLHLDYFQADRSGDQLINRSIRFGDETYGIDERVASSLDWRMAGLTYTFSVLRAQRYELGIGLGAEAIHASASAEAAVSGSPTFEKVSERGVLPVAVIDGTVLLAPRVALVGRARYISASVGGISGSFGDYHVDAQYRAFDHFSVGAGYSVIRTRIDVSDRSQTGRLSLDVKGPEVFVRVSF